MRHHVNLDARDTQYVPKHQATYISPGLVIMILTRSPRLGLENMLTFPSF